MPSYYEDLLRPEDYGNILNVHIYKPPLISTSLHELAAAGWNVWVEAKRVKTLGKTKIRLRFRPENGGPSGLNFDIWTDCHIGQRSDILQFMKRLDVIKEPQHLTEKAATFKSEISYQEVAYAKTNPMTFETVYAVPVKLDEQLYSDLKAVHGSENLPNELGRMIDDYFYDRQKYESAPVLSLIDMIMDHPDLGLFETEILNKINEKRGEHVKVASYVEPSMPDDLTEYFERVFNSGAEVLEPA